MQFIENVTLLGAGQVNKAIFADALAHAPSLVAVDGGAKIAVKLGQKPKYVIGDMDSINAETAKEFRPDQHFQIDGQDNTDFEKALNFVSAPLILGVGFLGKRLDHQLAAMNALTKFSEKKCVLIGKHDLCFHVPPRITLQLTVGQRFSLFPMTAVQGKSSGLKWPIQSLDFRPDGVIGTSNETTQATVTLEMYGHGMIAILPPTCLAPVINALGAV